MIYKNLTKRNLVGLLVFMIIGFFCIGVGAVIGSATDQWTTEKTNDVLIPQNAIVDFLTPNDSKDFKFSFSRPIEVIPGFWCVFLNSDMHTEKYGPDNFPYQHCWDRKEISDDAAKMAYIRKWQISLEYDAKYIGTGNHPKRWPGK